VTAGLIVCVAALAVATAGGLAWRQRNGRFARPASAGPAITRPPTDGEISGPEISGPEISRAELGQPLGPRATLVQFSSAFCAPCRASRRVLAEVAGMTDGVAHVEIDAESHLELVRRLDVRRTPTFFVLGPDGRIARRASGQPRKADLIAALGEVT
jgi:thiol-disulfide isomerase/thioredoxin